MEIADGIVEVLIFQVVRRNKEIQHSAVMEHEIPIIVAVHLKERYHGGVKFLYFREERTTEKLEVVLTIIARIKRY